MDANNTAKGIHCGTMAIQAYTNSLIKSVVFKPLPIKSSKYVITTSTKKNKNTLTKSVIMKGGKKDFMVKVCSFFKNKIMY